MYNHDEQDRHDRMIRDFDYDSRQRDHTRENTQQISSILEILTNIADKIERLEIEVEVLSLVVLDE